MSLWSVESARQAAKPASAERRDRRFRAAGHHHVGVAEHDQPRRVADGVRAGRAGRDDRVVRPFSPWRIETWPETRLMMLPE